MNINDGGLHPKGFGPFLLPLPNLGLAGVFSFQRPCGVVGMKMPDKDLGLLAWLLAWADTHWPALYGFILSVVISWLRVTYTGGAVRQRLLESVLCGAISLSVMSGMDMIGIPATASGFVGGFIGFLGVEKIRDVASRWLDRRFGNGQD
ncbi:phage holin, lambda family [Aeromonas hydrophila]|uniref:phage holin, lambda family n=1 Tax=Aeromonas hydrophila TaxID=644 RepID=UPI001F026A56|nr:phage holin, lambda family [Aeromonas hydrophila]